MLLDFFHKLLTIRFIDTKKTRANTPNFRVIVKQVIYITQNSYILFNYMLLDFFHKLLTIRFIDFLTQPIYR